MLETILTIFYIAGLLATLEQGFEIQRDSTPESIWARRYYNIAYGTKFRLYLTSALWPLHLAFSLALIAYGLHLKWKIKRNLAQIARIDKEDHGT